MCGFVGFYSDYLYDLEKSLVGLKHRGPDNANSLIMSYDEKNIGLGHVRLAIIDIDEKANQPFLSRDNRYILVYNGEIYNYLELKSELESDGFEFTTNSDTEVLINAFKKWGTKCFRKFRGMFDP